MYYKKYYKMEDTSLIHYKEYIEFLTNRINDLDKQQESNTKVLENLEKHHTNICKIKDTNYNEMVKIYEENIKHYKELTDKLFKELEK